ncbi:MAG: Ribosomal protein L11 methyltransferase [Gemmatimonadaceae bacterium]|nr:Ribosomal protein L11 methyltransferase [Gemmatimonadaceae bacterium]
MTWTSLRIAGSSHRDAVIAVLFAAGAQGVHEDGATLVTHFPDSLDVGAIVGMVQAADPSAQCVTAPTSPIDWSVAWRERMRAYEVGSLTVAPPWLTDGCDASRTVVIDPGMAFGTGDHASTRGALRLLQQRMRPGLAVADLGAGSGVLAIAAAKLGGSPVFAIEADPDAMGNATANVERNAVGDVVHLLEGEAKALLPLVAPVDLIVANIVSSVLLELLATFARALQPSGIAILAGILNDERETILDAVAADGWRVLATDDEEEWWSVAIARP